MTDFVNPKQFRTQQDASGFADDEGVAWFLPDGQLLTLRCVPATEAGMFGDGGAVMTLLQRWSLPWAAWSPSARASFDALAAEHDVFREGDELVARRREGEQPEATRLRLSKACVALSDLALDETFLTGAQFEAVLEQVFHGQLKRLPLPPALDYAQPRLSLWQRTALKPIALLGCTHIVPLAAKALEGRLEDAVMQLDRALRRHLQVVIDDRRGGAVMERPLILGLPTHYLSTLLAAEAKASS